MSGKRSGFAAVTLACVAAYAAPARADSPSDLEALLSERVITTSSTRAQTASAAPALSTTITAEELRTFGLRTLAEAVNFLSLAVVTADPMRTPDIGSRGVMFQSDDGKHFLLQIDGHAINDPLYGAARFDEGAGIPLDLVDHIEVIVGPGSVLYGSNAMMGVINVITKSARDYTGGHVAAEYQLDGTVRASAGTGFTFDLLGAPVEVTAGAEYFQRFESDVNFPLTRYPTSYYGIPTSTTFGASEPGPDVWGGRLTHAYFAQVPSAFVGVRAGDFELRVMASADRRGIPYATARLPAAFDDPNTYELDRAIGLDLRHRAALSALVQLTSRAYADSKDHQRQLTVPGVYCLRSVANCEYYDAGLVSWVGLEERLSLNWLHDQSLVTLLGVDLRYSRASAKENIIDPSIGQLIGPTAGHLRTDAGLIAPYLEQTWSPSRWLDLNVGARVDADTRFSPVLSPRAAAAVRPWGDATLKAVYSQAFRAPTWSETSLANYTTAPREGVVPETVRSVEGSFEQRFGSQRLLFGVFQTSWDNVILSTLLDDYTRGQLEMAGSIPPVVGAMVQYRNIASVENYGWNASWNGSLLADRLRYGLNVTGSNTKFRGATGPTPLAVAPAIFGNAHVAYAPGGDLPTLAFATYLLGPRPADRPPVNQIGLLPEAPTLADLRLVLTGRVPFVPGLSYRAAADYITASHGPYTAGPDPVFWGDPSQVYPVPSFVPIDQFQAFFGLRYDFATGSDGGKDP